MQQGALFLHNTVVNLDFPSPDREVVSGVFWGSIDAFPSPAYWAYQVLARRLEGKTITYKLGRTLREEVGACLLGGHGIPANVGLAAYHHLKHHGAFENKPPTEAELLTWLSEPLNLEGRLIKYRFARQKAKYLFCALQKLSNEIPPTETGKALRDWLLPITGIGYKTASWVARNWLDADDVAILDIHIYRAGLLGGFFEPDLTVERHYLQLEERFINLSMGLGVRASELDAVMWLEMMSSPSTVHRVMESCGMLTGKTSPKRSQTRTKQRHSNTKQTTLLI